MSAFVASLFCMDTLSVMFPHRDHRRAQGRALHRDNGLPLHRGSGYASTYAPTPLDAMRQPDRTAVCNTFEAVTPRLRPGQLVILGNVTYPGTTTEVMIVIFESM